MAKKVAPKKLPALAFRIYPDNGGFKWALQDGEGNVIAFSTAVPFKTDKAARAGVDAFRKTVKATADIPVLKADE